MKMRSKEAESVIIEKLTKLVVGGELEIGSMQIVLGMTANGKKRELAIVNKTRNEEKLLPFHIDFSEFINLLAKE